MTCAHNSVRLLTRYFERTLFNVVPLTRRLSVHLFVATLGLWKKVLHVVDVRARGSAAAAASKKAAKC